MTITPSRLRRYLAPLVVLIAAGIALSTAAVAGAGSGSVAARSGIPSVTVTFTDNGMRVSSMNPQAGSTTFVVVNHGKRQHLLQVKGPGVKLAKTVALVPGKQAKLTLKLKVGTYVLSDPVGLGEYAAQFITVIPATAIKAGGADNVVTPPATLPPMCGSNGTYNP